MNFIPLIQKCLGIRGTHLVKSLFFPNQLQIDKNGRKFTVNSKRDYLFWLRVKKGKWEPETFVIFDKFLSRQNSFIDVGAWLGATVLYGCQLAKHCYAVEPDPIAFEELKKNVELNKDMISRITLANVALSNLSGTMNLYQPEGEWGNSGSSILFDETKASKEVRSTTFQQFITDHSIDDCNFIKMDIEGGEFIVLPTMIDYLKTHKPTLLLELHPMYIKSPPQQLEEMITVFNIYDHIYDENLKEIDLESIFFSMKNKPDKTLRIVLTSLS